MKTLMGVLLMLMLNIASANGVCAFSGDKMVILKGLTIEVVNNEEYLCNGVKWCHKLNPIVNPLTHLQVRGE